METAKSADFFLGANSPNGFSSYFTEINDPKLTDNCYVIKGCPGSGKSTMMKTIAERLSEQESFIENIHCSSDPDSLDGVILHDSRTVIADGTPPHAIEPKLPIAYETIVSLYGSFDYPKVAAHRAEAADLDRKIKECHHRCCCYLSGAAALLGDNYRTAAECTDYAKVIRLAQKLAQKELPDKKIGSGTERKRLLSAITPKGILSYTNSVTAICDRIYVIYDEYSAASRVLLGALHSFALDNGYDIYSCYCPLAQREKLEHLFIPELRLGFVTQNQYIYFNVQPYRVIHSSRFTDKEKLKLRKQRMSFNKRAAKEILQEAVKSLQTAKQLHDDLERIYRLGIDFTRVEKIQEEVIAEMKRYYPAAQHLYQ